LLFKVSLDKRLHMRLFVDPCCLDIAMDLGVDLRAVNVDPGLAMESACRRHRRNYMRHGFCPFHHSESFQALPTWGARRTLLEMAIFCGQGSVAEKLASLGCAASFTITEFHVVWHAMLTPAQDAHAVVALQHVYQTERSRYEPLILQLARWWRRVPSGCGGSNIILQHAGIIELIARFALPVPFLLGVPQVHPRPAVREAWFDDGVQEGETEPVIADPLIQTYAQLEPVADIDPG